jgi:hypothetical protein
MVAISFLSDQGKVHLEQKYGVAISIPRFFLFEIRGGETLVTKKYFCNRYKNFPTIRSAERMHDPCKFFFSIFISNFCNGNKIFVTVTNFC